MAEYIDLNEAIIDFGFEWDDIAPNERRIYQFLEVTKKSQCKRNCICSLDYARGLLWFDV